METERLFSQLQRESEEILTGMHEWRVARPTATFAEIQTAVDDRLDRLRGRLLQEIAVASEAADGAERVTMERPTCPDCEERMAPRGTRDRAITVHGNETVTLSRSYWVCPACRAGLCAPPLRVPPGLGTPAPPG